jgi:hypothetical protein
MGVEFDQDCTGKRAEAGAVWAEDLELQRIYGKSVRTEDNDGAVNVAESDKLSRIV